jgi:flagellar assembly protein FliH
MSSSPLIPREQQSAYQRWELHSFEGAGVNSDFAIPTRKADRRAEDNARLETARREAHASGHAEGLREGRQQSLDETRRLRDLMAELTRQTRDINQLLADDLLRLALELSRQMVRRALAVRPELIVPLVKDALAQLGNARAPLSMTLHPADAAVVRAHLADTIESGHWNIVEDAQVQRGGCLLQTASSQLDATVGTRWQHLTAKLGLDDPWLE